MIALTKNGLQTREGVPVVVSTKKWTKQTVPRGKFAVYDASFAVLDDIRFVLEKGFCQMVVGLERRRESDFMHQFASGFNHIHARFCAKHGIIVGFVFEDVLKDRAFGRMAHILRLCEKYGVSYTCVSFSGLPLHEPDILCLFSLLLQK
ncbi:MAG: hypothetical protein ACMXYF_00610 [Candidatus Woesearchaeota archaeon]